MVVILAPFISAIDTHITDVFWCTKSHFMRSKHIILKHQARDCVVN